MLKHERTSRHTAREIDDMLRRGESLTDWERIESMTPEEIEAAVDFEEEGYPLWETTRAVSGPARKKQMTLRLDEDVIEFFEAQGPGYRTRIDAVLRRYMLANIDERRWETHRPRGSAHRHAGTFAVAGRSLRFGRGLPQRVHRNRSRDLAPAAAPDGRPLYSSG